jgi:chemotaxis protein MotB
MTVNNNPPRRPKYQRDIVAVFFVLLAILLFSGLMSSCVSKKKYNEALDEITRLSVDSTFQSYAQTDLAYKKEGVIYQQHQELLNRSYQLDSLQRLITQQKDHLSSSQAIMNNLSGESWDVENIEGRLLIQLDDEILFNSGESDLSEQGLRKVEKIVESISGLNQEVQVWVIGHTDNRPYEIQSFDNWTLSSQRAVNVVRAMIGQGLTASDVIAAARSKHDPEADNETRVGRLLNRRTEIIIVPQSSLNKALESLIAAQ